MPDHPALVSLRPRALDDDVAVQTTCPVVMTGSWQFTGDGRRPDDAVAVAAGLGERGAERHGAFCITSFALSRDTALTPIWGRRPRGVHSRVRGGGPLGWAFALGDTLGLLLDRGCGPLMI